MNDVENVSVEEQVLQESPPSIESEQEHNDGSTEAQESQSQQRNDAEYNWAEMRRLLKESKEEIEALRSQTAPPKVSQLEEPPDEFEDDDLVEGKHLKKLKKELKNIQSQLKESQALSTEDRIKLNFPDYYSVVSPENLKYLEKNEPELAETLIHSPNAYNQRVAAYRIIKQLKGIGADPVSSERKKAEENSQKPLSVNAITKQSAIGSAHMFENGLTKDVKARLWKEMEESRKGF